MDEPCTTTDWTPFEYSPSTSTASPESIKAFTDPDRIHSYRTVESVPYRNSRTRKRFRDGRPAEETIHHNTLAKLFEAQRQIHVDEQKGDWQMSSPAISPLTQWPPLHLSSNSTLVWQGPPRSFDQPERNQKSLDSFFGGVSKKQIHPKQASSMMFPFSTLQNMAPAVPRCEDCNAGLLPTQGEASVTTTDAACMDIDLIQDEWACACCSRQVCDTCAVRGDYRICLECAVSGGG